MNANNGAREVIWGAVPDFFGYFKKTQREVTPSEFSTLSIITIKGKIRNGVSVLLVGSVTIPEDEALLIYGE